METVPRRVSFNDNSWDKKIAEAVSGGLATRRIVELLPQLTESQINYRISQCGIKRAEYRNGKSKVAQAIESVLFNGSGFSSIRKEIEDRAVLYQAERRRQLKLKEHNVRA